MRDLLRIAYVINSVEGGGAASPVPAVTEVLRDGGAMVKVFALTGRDRRGLGPMIAAGLDVAVREGGEKDHVAALRWLDRELSAWRPTHLWTSLTRATLIGQLVARRRGWPVVSWQHAAFLKWENRWLLRLTEQRTRLWVGDSASVTALTAQRLRIPPNRLTEWTIFRADRDMPRARAWRPGETVRIGSLGRLHPVKGYDVLIAALAQLGSLDVEWQVDIAGDGEERAVLEAQARAAGVARVAFVGYRDDPRAFLTSLHLYIQPSRSEGLCVAAHEAMNVGVPIVASAVGELAHSVDDSVGALVCPGDSASLAEALRRLLSGPRDLHQLGSAARERVLSRFGEERFRATGLALLDRLRAM